MQTWSNGAFAFGLSGECRRVFAILPPFSRSHYRYIINKIHRARTKMTLPQIKTDMNQEEMNLLLVQARKASDLLKSLSHETRLMILCILSEGEKSVSELEEILAMPQAAVSQQLARLRLDGLVDTRREGRMIYYSILNHEVSSVIGTLYSLFCAPVRNEADHSID
jgi:DNA-binding transcriptional ArsR family regulator